MKREKVTGTKRPAYPTLDELLGDRRQFLKLLGKGALGVSVFGLAACDTEAAGGGDAAVGPGSDGSSSSDSRGVDLHPGTAGVAPQDIDEGPPPRPDIPEPVPGGVAPADIQEPPRHLDVGGIAPDVPEYPPLPGEDVPTHGPDAGHPPLPGDPPEPDIVEPPDVQHPPLPGEAPEPDAGSHADSCTYRPDVQNYPPLDGDMPAPNEGE